MTEAEPEVLVLQNDALGKTARHGNYRYNAKRRAKDGVYISRWRSPMTDKGKYTVQTNATSILRAGNFIEIDTAQIENEVVFDTEDGAVLDWQIIDFEECDNFKNDTIVYDTETVRVSINELNRASDFETTSNNNESNAIMVSPNPSNRTFVITLDEGDMIRSLEIKNLAGQSIFKDTPTTDSNQYTIDFDLMKGEYTVIVRSNNDVQVVKIIKI
jgi:hypothetical protein